MSVFMLTKQLNPILQHIKCKITEPTLYLDNKIDSWFKLVFFTLMDSIISYHITTCSNESLEKNAIILQHF